MFVIINSVLHLSSAVCLGIHRCGVNLEILNVDIGSIYGGMFIVKQLVDSRADIADRTEQKREQCLCD